jgi:serine/threonine protein kinase/tetratricopeptide (TPR) repeat protein
MSETTAITELVQALCLEQRKRWQEGDRVPADHFLEQHRTIREAPERAVELIYNEVLLREQAGEVPLLEEYLRRYPHFGEQLRRLFEVHRALDAPSLQRTELTGLPTDHGYAAPYARGDEPHAIAGYEVLGLLGRGGMGVVYKARDRKLNRVVALKMLRGGDTTAEELARFRREAEAQARLQHPNVVQVFEVGAAGGRPYFALEYVAGGSLAERLRGTPQPPRQAAELLRTLALAVEHAHQRGLVHRDLKPGNVLLAPLQNPEHSAICNLHSAIPRISDFGLAKHIQEGSGQTRTGEILGTPSYMAPEQAAGRVRDIGPTTDVWALGAILYEMLTGRPPFLGETPVDTLLQVKSQDPVPVRRLQPKVPRDLETIALKCLHKDKAGRYADAQALADDLGRFLDGRPILARPASPWQRGLKWCRRQPALAGLVAVVLLAVASLAGGGIWHYREMSAALQAADEKRREAQTNLRTAEEQRDEAQKNLRQARQAVDDMLMVGRDWFDRMKGYPDAPVVKRILTQILAINETFVKNHANDPSADRRVLGRAYGELGKINLLLRRYPDAEKALLQSAEIHRQLAAAHPDDEYYVRYQSFMYTDLEEVYVRLRRADLAEEVGRKLEALESHYARFRPKGDVPKEASPPYDQVIREKQALLGKDPHSESAWRALRDAFVRRAVALEQTGQSAEAVSAWDRALEIDAGEERDSHLLARAISLANTGDHAAATAVAKSLAGRRGARGVVLYDAACVYSVAGAALGKDPALSERERQELADRYARQAVGLLLRAADADFFKKFANRKLLKTDKDLDPLRPRADFRKLLPDLAPAQP